MIVLLLACMPCPDGLARDEDGVCVSTGGPVGEGAPPTEALFLTRFDERFCDELEDCWCDAYDLETCDPSLDCPKPMTKRRLQGKNQPTLSNSTHFTSPNIL